MMQTMDLRRVRPSFNGREFLAEFHWMTVIISLLSGGAVGSIITAAVGSWRNRVQPVSYLLEIKPIFDGNVGFPDSSAELSIPIDGEVFSFKNLHVVDIQISNTGNNDRSSFSWGITLPSGCQAVSGSIETPDRHHTSNWVSLPSPLNALQEVDLSLSPFNRGDGYRVKLYVTFEGDHAVEDPIIGTAEPVRFIRANNREILLELMASAAYGGRITLEAIMSSLRTMFR
ncbi:hypothetical protein [Aurantimonas endophytica]|uniref:Uncharacterized protein n=1 Tax=Aurantimonas endophytica TaxID=1522175 RepID=A0A7W6HC51_9HYPH|nr:hypothetical protein [Aurantimonas endophytica]MBB4002341.1 hypothetical protein [Aurantimonas endophytica]MCO6402035.1 hypothetical protein [Aurantimonas endophytica]